MDYKNKYEKMSKQVENFKEKNIKEERNGLAERAVSYDQQLMLDVIELEADVALRNDDIRLLSSLLKEMGKYIP